jgi:hypothetical protein
MTPVTAVYDAWVLHPAPLRDLLLRLALADLVRARWTPDIHAEWIRTVLATRPDLTLAQLTRTRQLMDAHVRDCLVEAEYQALIPHLRLPDAEDRHVLAAAIHTHARVMVTYNLRDFPADTLAPYGIAAQHPDAFVVQLLEQAPERVCVAVEEQRRSLRQPPQSPEAFLAILLRQGLPETVARLRTQCYPIQETSPTQNPA